MAQTIEERRAKQREANKRWRAKNLEHARGVTRASSLKWHNARKNDPEYRAARNERARVWKAAHPERAREMDRKGSARYKAKMKGSDAAWYERISRTLRGHGLTLDSYHAFAEKQDLLCAVCGQEPGPIKRHDRIENFLDDFVVDHDHQTHRVRGLLCSTCNVALGMLRDDPNVAPGAATYLGHHHAKRGPTAGDSADPPTCR